MKHCPRARSAHLVLALLSFCFLAAVAHGEAPDPLSREATISRMRAGVTKLNELYWSPTLHIWFDRPGDDLRAHYEGRLNPPWWPSANAVEMLVDFMRAAGTSEYDKSIGALYDLQKDSRTRRSLLVAELQRRHQWSEADDQAWQRELQKTANAPATATGYYSDFQNEYLDDSGWWGIAWLKMYDRTGAAKYLATAKTIHAHMAKNWMPAKGGGIMWCEDADKQRPNAITNSLFLILSSRLYQATGEQPYLHSAEKTLEWLHANALCDGIAVVDGIGHHGDYWSYNQGALIGGLTSLYEATGHAEYLDEAVKVAGTVLHRSGLMLPSGVLVEKLGTKGDATLFKGVLTRYLAQLRGVLQAGKQHPHMESEIDRCLRNSAESIMQHGIGADGLFGAEWHEGAKDHGTGFNAQISALTALGTAIPATP